MSEQIDEGSRITSTRFSRTQWFFCSLEKERKKERKEGRSNIWLRFFLPLSLL